MASQSLLGASRRDATRPLACPALILLGAAMILMTFLPVQASPTTGENTACVLPAVDRELLRSIQAEMIASPGVPATPFPDGVSGEPHSMPFPPPPGEAIDDATFFEVSGFFDALRVCFNAGDLEAVFGTFTRARWLREMNGDAASLAATLRALDGSTAPPSIEPISRIDVAEGWRLDGGSVIAITQWLPDGEWITFALVETADGWKIDDQWTGQGQSLVEPVTPAPGATALVLTPPGTMP